MLLFKGAAFAAFSDCTLGKKQQRIDKSRIFPDGLRVLEEFNKIERPRTRMRNRKNHDKKFV
jgi:hypothetical protein